MDMDFSGIVYMAMFGFFIGVPLSIWKLVDIVIWLVHHLHWVAQ